MADDESTRRDVELSGPLPIDLSHPVIKYLWPLGSEAAADDRVAAAFRAYAEATGITLSASPTADERHQVCDWLHNEDRNMPRNVQGYSLALLYGRRSSVSGPLVSPDLASKIGWLQQAHCRTCIAADLRPLSISFPIRVRPFSAQSLSPRALGDLKMKIVAYMAKRNWELNAWSGFEVCVTIIAIMPEGERRKDVDNMAKGLLDAMQGSVYTDDRLVQHLSIRRVLHSGFDGWYKVHVMPVLDSRADVVDPTLRVGGWAKRR